MEFCLGNTSPSFQDYPNCPQCLLIYTQAFNDHRTQSLLEKWAGHERLIKVSHYFWNSGTSDQRSHAGLLRGLLYKILCQCGFLIPEIFPDVWRDKITKPLFLIEEMGAVSWTLLKLSQAFDRLLSSQSRGLKFCLFVDGLDEYDGDYFEITQIFTRISASPNVKICVSSRPLSDFVFAFRACPSLRLQDLTSGDIQQYIDHELGNNAHMKVLREENPTMAQTLVSEIINKADGVFLWVKLVVLSLLRGLRQSDDMNDLQVRLNLLPPSLEDLFSHILGRLDPAYLEQSSRIFQIFAEAQKINDASLTSLELSFAEELDSKTVISEETRKLSTGELIARSSRVDIWLRTRCGGLIEMHSAEDDTGNQMLSYLHRTVRDFLELPEIWSIVLKPTIGKDFISSVALLQSQVLYIKWVLPFPSTLTARIYELQRVAKRALSFAKLAETANRTPQMAMLNELDRVCTDLIRGFVPDTYSWTTLENTIWADPDQNSLITLAITYGLYYYLEKKLKMEPWHMEKGGRPLLYYAVSDRNYLCGYRSGVDVYPDVVELLFRHGAKAGETYAVQIKHEVYETLSPWQLVLQSLFELLARPQTKEITRKWLSVVKLFLENGAEPTQCLHNDDSKTAYSLVHALSDEPHEVKALLLSPGILRERAEQERREQRAKDTAQAERVSAKRDCTQLKNDIAQDVVSSEAKSLSSYRDPSAEKALGDTSSSRAALPKEVPRTASASQQPFVEVSKSPSAEVSLPVSQTVTVSNLSSWSTRPRYELEADPPIPPNSEEFEISITSQIEAIALNSIPSYYGFESTSVLADRDFEYNRALETDFDILPWNLPLESRDCIAPSVASEQNWNHMQQYGISSQQVPKESELPPPIPPKIPLLLTVAPATQSPTIIQSPSQMRPSSAASRALPQWGARWNAIGPNVQESHDSLSPNDTTPWNNNDVSNPRPSSAYGIPAHSQPTLSHHRSYNSLSFTQNASGYQNRSTQQEYLPYRNPDKFQQQTNQSLSHTYTPPTQMSYERPSPAMLYIDTNYNAPVTPHESSNQQYFHHVKYPSYVTVQSTIPSPVSTTSPYSAPHQTRFQDTNTYQQLSPSYLSPQSSQDTQWSHFSHQVPDSSPPYSPAQYSAASPFSSRSGYGHDDGNVRMKEREQFNVEVTPVVENTRPMSWFGRFRKSSRT